MGRSQVQLGSEEKSVRTYERFRGRGPVVARDLRARAGRNTVTRRSTATPKGCARYSEMPWRLSENFPWERRQYLWQAAKEPSEEHSSELILRQSFDSASLAQDDGMFYQITFQSRIIGCLRPALIDKGRKIANVPLEYRVSVNFRSDFLTAGLTAIGLWAATSLLGFVF
jgi:hypothetical protein